MAANVQTNQHTHASCNAVPLVWGSLRLTPINGVECCMRKAMVFRQVDMINDS